MTLNELLESVCALRGWTSSKASGSVSLTIPQSGNRRQKVSVSEFKDEGQPMLRFTTSIGGAGKLDPAQLRTALKLNLRMPHGCLAVDGTELVMTVTRPLKTSTPETTGDALEFLSRQADQYENLIYKTDVH